MLPFVALAAASVLAHLSNHPPAVWQAALLAYGATILSFVGALHWGFAMALRDIPAAQRTASFVWSVMPALMAWVALLTPPQVATALIVAGLCVHYWRDRRLAVQAGLPSWYLPMRLRLTWVACLCLLLGATVAMLHSGVAG